MQLSLGWSTGRLCRLLNFSCSEVSVWYVNAQWVFSFAEHMSEISWTQPPCQPAQELHNTHRNPLRGILAWIDSYIGRREKGK